MTRDQLGHSRTAVVPRVPLEQDIMANQTPTCPHPSHIQSLQFESLLWPAISFWAFALAALRVCLSYALSIPNVYNAALAQGRMLSQVIAGFVLLTPFSAALVLRRDAAAQAAIPHTLGSRTLLDANGMIHCLSRWVYGPCAHVTVITKAVRPTTGCPRC
jgi:hypothetical protein